LWGLCTALRMLAFAGLNTYVPQLDVT